jgi:flagellar assembly protein FliH
MEQMLEIPSLEETHDKQLMQKYELGFADGREQMKKELEQNYQHKLLEQKKMLQEVITSVDEKLVEYDRQFETIVLNLAFLVSEKIIKREIEIKSTIDETLKFALKKVLGANKVIIKLNQKDLEHLKSNAEGIFNDDIFSRITFESDERIEAGGCLVETEIGNVESRINTQLAELKKLLELHLFNSDNP